MLFIFIILTYSTNDYINCTDAEAWQMICLEEGENFCILDQYYNFSCTVFPSTLCKGERTFTKYFPCRYCYQLPLENLICDNSMVCDHRISSSPATCRANYTCIGASIFDRQGQCKRKDKSQKIAFILSLFLGSAAADRFYLGHYVTASFKLLTVGGFGIVYMIDLVLIALGYLGPADGSLYRERV
ncbi:TM2 domain containing protein [Tritrichomonas foetus]|uniref:TM2 domain containing protein n=1 Tax=Tritrichomonas foetus TaxID=1144522 RepID=A0A1J4KFM9_9EUKA|nr:TM2 domain containing protein [Tritrichomonas foetus]|eukprot:OHT10231.1 TM2 domain containing protein [Tritrichomonas foetus]